MRRDKCARSIFLHKVHCLISRNIYGFKGECIIFWRKKKKVPNRLRNDLIIFFLLKMIDRNYQKVDYLLKN